ncbi:hypothetical protein FACS1894217_11360 [Clostridia bacterium]|nr:hypothetical protein FACS1894217_11360 [Clostridia bacterium]
MWFGYMDRNERNLDIIEHVLKYCNGINAARNRFGNSFDAFSADWDYQNSVSLCLLQIGELAKHLSEDFKLTHGKIRWRGIIGLRNVLAHDYERMDIDEIWDVVEKDVPLLRDYCAEILQ